MRFSCSAPKRATIGAPSSPGANGISSSCPCPRYRARNPSRRALRSRARAPARAASSASSSRVSAAVERMRAPHHARQRIATLGRDREPERAQHPRERRHEHGAHAEQLRERARVQRPAAAERDERAPPRIDAALHAHAAQRARHRRIGGRAPSRAPRARRVAPSRRRETPHRRVRAPRHRATPPRSRAP